MRAPQLVVAFLTFDLSTAITVASDRCLKALGAVLDDSGATCGDKIDAERHLHNLSFEAAGDLISKRHPSKCGMCSLKPTPLLMFRKGASGSTWITALLNSESRHVYMCRECVPHWAGKSGGRSEEQVADYMVQALSHPAGSIVAPRHLHTRDLQPETRKCIEHADVGCEPAIVGLTMDPHVEAYSEEFMHNVFVQTWHRVPDVRVVIFRRTNIVKKALAKKGFLAGQRGTALETAVLDDVFAKVGKALSHDQHLLNVIRRGVFPNMLNMSYEEVQIDEVQAVNKVLRFSGYPFPLLKSLSNPSTKKSPEDLRLKIANFDEVDAALTSWHACLSEMFREKGPRVFDPCEPGPRL